MRDIFENVADGICKTNEAGDYLLVNPSFAKLYGFDDVESFRAHIHNASQLYANLEDRSRLLVELGKTGSVVDFNSKPCVRVIRRARALS